MLLITSTECRTIAEKKLVEARRDTRHGSRLTNAAQGWLFLAGQLKDLEKSLDLTVAEKDADVGTRPGRILRRGWACRRHEAWLLNGPHELCASRCARRRPWTKEIARSPELGRSPF